MESLPVGGGMTYETYYGLREKPFSLLPDPRFAYRSLSYALAFEELSAAIRRRENLSVVTGGIGTGKTTLCRAVLGELNHKAFSAFVPDPLATREEFLKMVLIDFGVVSVDDVLKGRLKDASPVDLTYLLYEFLGTLAPLDAFAVVVVDEAQDLTASLLEEIRVLTDASSQDRQLQVILVGQPELAQTLKTPEMEQIDLRVSIRCELEPLNGADVAGYVAHRLRVAGGGFERVRFSPAAVDLVHQMSGGVPRLINRICDRALAEGHLRRITEIDVATVITGNQEILPAEAKAPLVTPPVPVERAAAPAPAPAPEFGAQIDTWLTTVDANVKVETHEHGAPPVAQIRTEPAVETLEMAEQEAFPSPERSRKPPRSWIEGLIRTVGRIAFWLVALVAALAAASYVVSLTLEPVVQPPLPARPIMVVAPMPEAPVPPNPLERLPRR